MAVSLTRFDKNDHTATINLGTQEMQLRHLSDQQISAFRANFPSLENVPDLTGLPVFETT